MSNIRHEALILPLVPSYLVVYLDSEQNILVAVAVVDLQHRPVLCPLRAVVDVLNLFPWQLLQLESAESAVAVETGQLAIAGRLKHHDQNIGCVVRVVDLQDRLGDGCQAATALHGKRREGHDSRGLGRILKNRRNSFEYNLTAVKGRGRFDLGNIQLRYILTLLKADSRGGYSSLPQTHSNHHMMYFLPENWDTGAVLTPREMKKWR